MKILEKMIYALEYIENGQGKEESVINMMNVIKNHLVEMSVAFFGIAILIPFLTIYLYNYQYPDSVNGIMGVDNIGSTADFLAGTMTPFLTIAAFFLLLKGYFMQKEELTQTSKELSESTKALNNQLTIMKKDQKLNEEQKEFEFCIKLINDFREEFSKIEIDFWSFTISKDEEGNNCVRIDYQKQKKIKLDIFYGYICNIINKKCNGVNEWKELDKIQNELLYEGNLKSTAEFIICAYAYNYYAKLYFLLHYIDTKVNSESIKTSSLKYLSVNLTVSERFLLHYIRSERIILFGKQTDDFIKLLDKFYTYVCVNSLK